jgi:transcriptional regulator with XRE-family HTH domain
MDHPLRQILGERIHLARRRSGLSQVELATRAAISPTTLNRVELGRQKLYADTLVTLARILGVSVDYLVGMTDDDRTLTLRGRQADDDAPRPLSAPLKAKRATRAAPSPRPSRKAAIPARATARSPRPRTAAPVS